MLDTIIPGDYREILPRLAADSATLVVTSLPDHPASTADPDLSEFDWTSRLYEVIRVIGIILRPGGFLALNAADILCYPDASLPRLAAQIPTRQKHITREMVLKAQTDNPAANLAELAKILGCSEQTIQRRLQDNNARGGGNGSPTRVQLIGPILEDAARRAGLYLYDRRVWVKTAAWTASRWHNQSYRSIDEFENIYIFLRPGSVTIDRTKLAENEWREWGSRGVWYAPPSPRQDYHLPERFPLKLARRLVRLLSAPEDLVVDPFLRSGTTAVAALMENRHYVGIESDAGYLAVARQRIANAMHDL